MHGLPRSLRIEVRWEVGFFLVVWHSLLLDFNCHFTKSRLSIFSHIASVSNKTAIQRFHIFLNLRIRCVDLRRLLMYGQVLCQDRIYVYNTCFSQIDLFKITRRIMLILLLDFWREPWLLVVLENVVERS